MENEEIKRPGKNATKTQREKFKNYLKIESKEQRFKRVSRPIIKKSIRLLTRLSKMVGSSNYAPTDIQINNMTEILHTKVENIKTSFNPSKQGQLDISNQEVDNIFN